MRNIDGSSYLKNPELDIVETKKNSVQGATFILFAEQAGAAAATEAEPTKPKKRVASTGARP
jgi:hypothetical protein